MIPGLVARARLWGVPSGTLAMAADAEAAAAVCDFGAFIDDMSWRALALAGTSKVSRYGNSTCTILAAHI